MSIACCLFGCSHFTETSSEELFDSLTKLVDKMDHYFPRWKRRHYTLLLKWRRLSVTNYSSQNNLPKFRLNAPVIIRAKVKRCEQTLLFIAIHYWGYTSLKVKGGRRLSVTNYSSENILCRNHLRSHWKKHYYFPRWKVQPRISGQSSKTYCIALK